MLNSKEQAFIFSILRAAIHDVCGIHPQDLPQYDANLNEQRILHILSAHRLLPLLSHLVSTEKDIWRNYPVSLRHASEASRLLTEQNLKNKLSEYAEIRDHFTQERIPLLPLKGILLSTINKKISPFRYMGDVDIAVPPSYKDQAVKALQELGFQPDTKLIMRSRYLGHKALIEKQLVIRGRNNFLRNNTAIDLHWDFHYNADKTETAINNTILWDRPNTSVIEIAASKVPPTWIFGHLLIHALHNYYQGFPRFWHLLDLSFIAAQYPIHQEDVFKLLTGPDCLEEKKALELYSQCALKWNEIEKSASLTKFLLPFFQWPFKDRQSNQKIFQASDFIRKLPHRDAVKFILGYFFPAPEYYKRHFLLAIPQHAWHLMRIFLNRLNLVFTKVSYKFFGESSPLEFHTDYIEIEKQHNAAIDILREHLLRNQPVEIRAQGSSMLPVIFPGDTLVVQYKDPASLQIGDIILMELNNGLIVHRIINIRQDPAGFGLWFKTMGDSRNAPDEEIYADAVLAKVISFGQSSLRKALGNALDRHYRKKAIAQSKPHAE